MISYSGLRHNGRLGVVYATPTMCLQHFDTGALFLLVTGIRASPACYCIMEMRIPAETSLGGVLCREGRWWGHHILHSFYAFTFSFVIP